MNIDSIDKIVGRYFSVLTKEEFTYKKKTYVPKKLHISPLLLRGFTCPSNCAACCLVFSLDYIPLEEVPPIPLTRREIYINGKAVTVFTDFQNENTSKWCMYASHIDGRCKIHGKQPFSCDFELIRPLIFRDKETPNILTQKLFGRAWALTKIDNTKGARCVMTPPSLHSVAEVKRKLLRLEIWMSYAGIENTYIPSILTILEKSGALTEKIILTP